MKRLGWWWDGDVEDGCGMDRWKRSFGVGGWGNVGKFEDGMGEEDVREGGEDGEQE